MCSFNLLSQEQREILKTNLGKTTLELVKGDITERRVGAIVNAANSRLQHGGGVAGAILRKGGSIIQDESNKTGFVSVGSAAVTSGGKLPCRYVIHAVGPQYGEGDEDNKLKNAVCSSLDLASKKKLRSVSVPAISSGIFGFPKKRCAEIILEATKEFIEKEADLSLETIEFCVFDDETYRCFEEIIESIKKERDPS